MKKRIDGRTVKGQRIRELVRENILTSYIDLIRGGVPVPTARETADRAGLSLRAIFNYFPDLRTLQLTAFSQLQAESSKLLSDPVPEDAPATRRLELFVDRHTQRLEYVTPLHRAAAMVESVEPDVAAAMKNARNVARRDLEKTLSPALQPLSAAQRRALLTELHLICSWESWEFLRKHYQLLPRRARAVIMRLAQTALAAAGKRTASPR